MNKRKLLISSLCFLFFFNGIAFAQSRTIVKKIHAYQQTISGGAMITTNESNPSAESKTRYWVYLETGATNSVTVKTIYIKGIAYSALAEKSSSLILLPGATKKNRLTQNTANKLWQLTLQDADATATTANALKKLVQQNDVVIAGFAKGKSFTISLKKIKILPPVDAE